MKVFVSHVLHYVAMVLVLVLVLVLPCQYAVQLSYAPKEYLDIHNAARKGVGVRALSWNETLADYGQKYANKLSSRGYCDRTNKPSTSGGPYGENVKSLIAYGKDEDNKPPLSYALEEWDLEKRSYFHWSKTYSKNCMSCHYTQIFWNDTHGLGCGASKCYKWCGLTSYDN